MADDQFYQVLLAILTVIVFIFFRSGTDEKPPEKKDKKTDKLMELMINDYMSRDNGKNDRLMQSMISDFIKSKKEG